jgi:kynurenine formamidase
MLGVDMPSPDYPPFPVHKLLLNKGIFVLENLTGLEQLLGIKHFEVFEVPLKIHAEASLTRAFARCSIMQGCNI